MMKQSKRNWKPIGLWVALAAAPLWSLSGCGGGGNDVTVPPPVVLGTPTPAPSPTATSASNPPIPGATPGQTVFTPNYAAALDDQLRWSSYPITVYFVPNANLTAARRTIAITGFDQWVTSTQNRVRYNVVNTAAGADISVTFSPFTGGGGDELGVANITFDPNTNLIVSVAMNIGITGDNREDVQTAAHEFGHSIGIGGHSPNRADLMYFSGNSAGCSCITPSDLNTLFTIYGGQFNTSTRTNARTNGVVGPLRTITIH